MKSVKTKAKPARAAALSATRATLCSAWELDSTAFTWDNRWGVPMEAAAAGMFAGDDVLRAPSAAIFQQARRWTRLVAFIQRIHALRQAFIYHGLLGQKENIPNPRQPDVVELEWHPGIRAVKPADQERLNKWKQANAAEIQRLLLEVGRERLVTRNVVALWQPGGRVLVRPPEQCAYKDEFGWEELTIVLNLTAEKIEKMNLPAAAKRELLKNPKKLTLDHDSKVFQFSVLKDESVGMGFGWPDLMTLFHACRLEESLLVGDYQLAEAARAVYEQHKLGHEIRSGPHAGSPAHFANKDRREGTLKQVKDVKGHKKIITNFDHEILIGAGRPDPKHYDAARYKTIAEKLALWGVPYAQMWSGVVNPFLMTLARQDAERERLPLQPFLAELVRALGCPVDVWIRFDNSCFWDQRMLLDLLKTGLAGGPLSQGTFLKESGFRQSDELERKTLEAGLKAELVEPAYDAAHGPPKPGLGKPAGKNDKS